jgi:hypothetical protein
VSIILNSKTYNWAQFDPAGASRYTETAGGVPTSFSPLTARVSEGTGKTRKVKWRLAIPTVATTDSDCSCAGTVLSTDYVNIEIDLSATGTLASRQDILARLQALVLTAQFEASVENLVQPAG